MPKYLIRRNMNGRPLGQICETYPSDEDAVQVAQRMQELENKILMERTESGLPRRAVPKIEVLKLIWEGEPKRADPERIRKRREKLREQQEGDDFDRFLGGT